MARTSGTRSPRSTRNGRRSTNTVTGFDIFVAPHQHWSFRALGYIVRARAELFIATVVIGTYLGLQRLATSWGTPLPVDPSTGQPAGIDPAWGSDTTLIIMIVIGGVIVIVPASRHFVNRRLWCVTTRHRIRAAFNGSRTRTMTRNGRLPLLLWSRPSPVGERVRVWLPAGLSVNDIERMSDEFATACWARDARIIPTRAQAALVIIEIVRRDPLAASRPLTPVLISDLTGGPTPGSETDDHDPRPLPDRRAIIPKVAPPSTTGTTGTATPRPPKAGPTPGPKDASTPDKPTDPPVNGFGGMDVTDYI